MRFHPALVPLLCGVLLALWARFGPVPEPMAQTLRWDSPTGDVYFVVRSSTNVSAPLPWPICGTTSNFTFPVILCGGGPRRFFYVESRWQGDPP